MKGRDMGLRFAREASGGWAKLTICIFRSSHGRTIDDGELFYGPELNLFPAEAERQPGE